MMAERGTRGSHTTVLRWVIRYVPEFEKRWNLNNVVEQDHRAIKRRCSWMTGFKSTLNAAITISGIELAHPIRKRQFSFGPGTWPRSWSLKRVWERALA